MGEMEVGTCEICGKKDVGLRRKYYTYAIVCECCLSGGKHLHSELVRYCKDCTPRPPKTIKPSLNGADYIMKDE